MKRRKGITEMEGLAEGQKVLSGQIHRVQTTLEAGSIEGAPMGIACSTCGLSKNSMNHYTGSADYDHPFKAARCPTCFAEVKQPVTRCIRTCHSHVPSPCVTCTDKWHAEDIPKKCDNCGAPVTLPRELCDECRGN